MTEPAVSCTIDLTAPGKQIGRLQFPKISNTAGWAFEFVPIAAIGNGDGPTVLISAGNHGDEYEGQVAALRLINELRPEQVHGRIVVIPVISTEASKANTRMWPSGVNFNRSFPGSPEGPPNEQLADYFTRVLFPMSDVVVDLHSGGRTAWFIPCSHMHVVADAAQRKAMLEGMLAWNSDFHFLYVDVNGNGLLPVEAENQGKIVITTELGGGGRVPAPVHRLAWSGLTNVLRHVGVLEGEVETRASLGLPEAVILDGRDATNYVIAEEGGLFEGLLEPGEAVAEGDPVGRLWFPDTPRRDPVTLRAPHDGVLAVIRAVPVTDPGNSVFVIGQPVEASALL
ncbi:MAG TPA: succinylglutamate desuccinylase/aspartoacylase family protein [Gaiellaceae bacterium]|jgi:N-alpha-acetyl-L-2,4-diaminobutyrate deacetylase|nr:succinylglutamate desuccinylase/aspartoacylase family protein [Gaiellaceae bacterium]